VRRAHCLIGVLVVLGVTVAGNATGSNARVQAQATVTTVAGTGVDGSDGDGGPAIAAAINHPRGIAVLRDGSFVFAQPFVPMVRRVTPGGVISRVAGNGTVEYSGDGGPAIDAELSLAHGVAALPDGGFLIADMGNNRIRRVWPDGRITTVVGNGVFGYAGDGGPATAASIALPRGVAARPNGELLIPDTTNARVRRVSPQGVITTVAGTGQAGFSGDGGPATAAQLNRPFSVAPLPDGGFLIADLDNNRIRRVAKDGIITTVAGTGTPAFFGDGGPAIAAAIYQPHAVAVLPDGGFLIADTYNHRVRRVWPNGAITTAAGTGVAGFGGDGPAATAALNFPKALAVLPDGSGFLVGDAVNHRVRLVRMNLRPLLLRVTTPRLKTRAGRAATLRYTVSEAATVRLEAVKSGVLVASARRRAKVGANRLEFGRLLGPGTYTLDLSASTNDGRRTVAKASLSVRR
jgi:NHL repeat